MGSFPRGSYFSPDDRKLYCLVRRTRGARRLDGEIWVTDLSSGRSTPVLAGFNAAGFDTSDDGTRVVFTARRGEGPNQLWVRALADSEARPLAGTEGGDRPFWSADGRHIGFFANRALRKIDANGGSVFKLVEANESRGGTWNKDGVILYTPDARGPIYRVSANGDPPVVALVRDGRTLLDVRTLREDELDEVAAAVDRARRGAAT